MSALIALLALFSPAEAAEPAWQFAFPPAIDWYEVTETGHVMVGNEKSIVGIDPATGKPAWERADLRKVGDAGVTQLQGAPAAMVLEAEYKLGKIPTGTLHMLDVSTGKDLWTKQGGPVVWTRPFYADAAMMYLAQDFGPKGLSYTMSYVDLVSGAVKWESKDYLGGNESTVQMWLADPTAKAKAFTMPKLTAIGNQPLVFVDGGAAYLELWTYKQGLVKRSMKDGSLLWSNPTKFVDDLVPTPHQGGPLITIAGDRAFITDNGGRLLAYQLSDGKPVWSEKDAPKMPGTIRKITAIGDDVLVAGDDTKKAFAMVIDGETGQKAWKKPVKIKGMASFIDVLSDGSVIFGESTATSTLIHVIDPKDGSEKLRAIKLPGGITYAEIKGGKFFATGSNGSKTYVQLIDLSTGQSAWSAGGYRAKGTIANLVTHDGKVYFVDSSNNFNALDLATGKQVVDVEIPVKGKGEVVSNLMLRPNGTFVTLSSQNVVGLNADGTVAFSTHYPPPPLTGLQVVAGVVLIAAAAGSAAASASAAYGEGYAAGSGQGAAAAAYGAEADAYGDMAVGFGSAATAVLTRAKASKASENYYFILTKVGEGKDAGVGLIRVDLDTGAEAGSVVLDTREPDYKIDEIGGWVYLMRDESTLEGYKL